MFQRNLGRHSIRVSVEELDGNSRFNAKIVFHNIETLLRRAGYTVQSRVRKDSSLAVNAKGVFDVVFSIRINIRVEVLHEKHDNYNAMVVFDGLTQELQERGLNVTRSEKTESGPGTSLALRYNLTK
jgi:hypothetical protein